MAVYRAYVIGTDGRFNAAHTIECDDDEGAVEAARQYVNGHDVEVWQQHRKLTRLEHKPDGQN